MSNGWIKLHRELTDKAIWAQSTMQQKVILITILMMANHEEKQWIWKGERFVCKPGQFITSLKSIAEMAGPDITVQNVRTALTNFEKLQFLTNKSTKHGRLITIVNWGKYQDKQTEANKQTNNQSTDNQQTANNQLTTNKKEEVRSKNNKNTMAIPTLEEINAYCKERQSTVQAEEFFDFYQSKGWKVGNQPMKDWKAAIRNWENRRKGSVVPKNKFNRFEQRDYDFGALQKQLTGRAHESAMPKLPG